MLKRVVGKLLKAAEVKAEEFSRKGFHKPSTNFFQKTSQLCKGPARLAEKIRDSILIVEAKQGPVGKVLIGVGQGLATGGLVFGSGAFIYHTFFDREGIKYVNSDSDNYLTLGALAVPQYVRDRVETAYMYLANSLAVSALGAVASFRLFSTPAFLNFVAANPFLAIGVTMGTQFVVTMLVRSLPYKEGFGLKQAGSVMQAALIGLSAAPMYLIGAQSIVRAGYVSAGVIGGLTGISTIVPHDSFLKWETPLRIGMYSVFFSFMSLWFLPQYHPLYNIVYKVAMHGGLVVFPAYYLYNSKALIQTAMFAPQFDPINTSMAMYTDVLNIYGRLAFLLPPRYFISGDTRSVPWTASQNKSKESD